jgi:hypothetical protein
MISEEALAKFRRLMDARVKRDESKKQAETDEKEYRDIEAEVYEMLDASEVEGSFRANLGEPYGSVLFTPRKTHFGRVIDDQQAIEYYKEHQMLDQVSAPKFVMKRIHEDVRDALEQDGEFPPGIDYYTRYGVTITQQKGSS